MPPGTAMLSKRAVDMHPIAVDTGFVMDDLALVDSDPVPYSARLFDLGVALRHGPLNGDRALHGVHDAAELSKDPVARRVDDTTTVLPIIGRMTAWWPFRSERWLARQRP